MIYKIFLGIWKFIKRKILNGGKERKGNRKERKGNRKERGDRERKVERKEKSCKGDRVQIE